MSAFIEVTLSNWDCEKVSIGLAPGGKTPTVLYEKKIPILKVFGNDSKDKYVLSSYDGLKRNMKWDGTTRKYLDVWEGDWSISFKVSDTYAGAEGLNKKIITIFEDITIKIEKAFKRKPSYPLNVKVIKEKNEYGVEEEKGIDPTKPVYLKVKVGYDAPKDAPKFFDQRVGKEVPALTHRTPKADFFDIKRPKDYMKVQKPDTECQIGMKAVPKFIIGLYATKDAIYITKRLLQCYYEPASMGGGGIDEDLTDILRRDDDLSFSQ